jgi:membrane protein implicated in regulation of membrane protease activity
MTRILHILSMSILGLAGLAAVVVLAVFAASVLVVGVAALALFALGAFLCRTPVRIFVRSREARDDGKGVYEARKKGSTWSVY